MTKYRQLPDDALSCADIPTETDRRPMQRRVEHLWREMSRDGCLTCGHGQSRRPCDGCMLDRDVCESWMVRAYLAGLKRRQPPPHAKASRTPRAARAMHS